MGSTTSVVTPDVGAVLAIEYNTMQDYLKENKESPATPDKILQEIMEATCISAQYEMDFALAECRNPALILYKYNMLSEVDRLDHTEKVIAAANAREKDILLKKNAVKPIDNSKCFGGTEADSKNEKDAAELLRGTAGKAVEEDSTYPILLRPQITHKSQYNALKAAGTWIKYMGSGGCYMYLHSLTRDVVSLRPDDFEEPVLETNNLGAELEVQRDPANGIKRIEASELPGEIDRIVSVLRRTPLIFDCSASQPVRSFFAYKGHCEDISCLTVPFGKSGLKREDVMERCRARLVSALKTGGTFCLYLGDVAIEHADLKTKLCKKDVFPKEVFQCGGLKLLQPEYDPKYKHIYREADLEQGQPITRDGFRAVVLTTLDPYRYEELLGDCIPLGYMTPVYVNFRPGE